MEPLLLVIAPTAPSGYVLSATEVFALLFLMLGPLKIIGPFFVQTREQAPAQVRELAFKVFALAVVSVVAGGWIGARLLDKWQVSTTVLQLAAGLIFLLTALQLVLAQYAPAASAPAPTSVMHLLFPVTITPYGMAAVILLLAHASDARRYLIVMLIALLVLVLDCLAMLGARVVMRAIGPVPLQLLGAVLGVLQVALALAILLGALHRAGLLPPLLS